MKDLSDKSRLDEKLTAAPKKEHGRLHLWRWNIKYLNFQRQRCRRPCSFLGAAVSFSSRRLLSLRPFTVLGVC